MVEIIEEPDELAEQTTQEKSLTPLQQEGLQRTCNGCGGSPRVENGRPMPLKRCSVCHEAWYHDRECQQKDFPMHKKMCTKLLKERQRQEQLAEEQKLVCRVEESHSNRGRYLVANERLAYGTVIGPKNATCLAPQKMEQDEKDPEKPHNKLPDRNPHNHWEPIVAPVLLENHRSHRCVVCFGLFESSSQNVLTPLEEYYPTRLCSDACRRLSASFLPSEQQAIELLQQRPPMMLPTAILLYRLVLAIERDTSGRVKTVLSRLQSERTDDPTMSEEEQAHEQAVCATTWAMMKAISTLPMWKLEDLSALLKQAKLNGFSVCTAESVALGIGIYTAPNTSISATCAAPNLINHNCQPNLLQTFDYGSVGRFPSLRLTVCVPAISTNDEITLSYIDNSMPSALRQDRLLNDYGFRCDCAICQKESDRKNPIAEEKLKFQSIEDIKGLAIIYDSLKQSGKPSSWYARECGEKLLQMLLDELGGAEDAKKQYSLAAQAFQLTEELASGPTTEKNAMVLRDTILRYKAIKLRLFLNVHPQQAMDELETNILPTCTTFFPGHHELMRQIVQDCCL